MMSDQLIFVNQTGTAQVRRETVGGVEYLIAPTVAIKAGVLNGELVTADEIGTHFHSWDGRPFVVGHPKADGEDTSVNDPALLAKMQLGWLFNTHFDDGALKGEIWVDVSRAKLVDGGPEIVARLEGGRPLEISTAYFRDRDEKPGTLDGTEYEAVARNLRPDHLAALLDGEGACSWADGCGAPRVNARHRQDQCMLCKKPPEIDVLWAEGMGRAWFCFAHYEQWKKEHPGEVVSEHKVRNSIVPEKWGGKTRQGEGETMEANVLGKARTPTYSGTTDAPWEAPTLEGWLAAYPGDKPDSNRVADLPQAAKDWIAGHTLLGDPAADNERDLAFFPVVTPQGKLSGGAVRAVLGGRAAQANIPQAAKESAQAVARALLEKEFKTEQATNKDRVLCALKAIAGVFGIEFNQQDTEVSKMAELIKAILEDGRLGLNEEQLQALDEDVLSVMLKALKATPKAEEEPEPEPESNEEPKAKAQKPEAKPEPETNEAMQVLEDRIVALEAAAKADDDARKAKLVTALTSNATCTLTGDQLKALDVATLDALAHSFSPADYSGQSGGLVAGNRGIEKYEMPDIFAEAQEV